MPRTDKQICRKLVLKHHSESLRSDEEWPRSQNTCTPEKKFVEFSARNGPHYAAIILGETVGTLLGHNGQGE